MGKRLIKILELWKEAAMRFPRDVHFDFPGNLSHKSKIEEGVNNFIKKRDETSFKEFWKLLYSAKQKAHAENVWNTNKARDLIKVISEIKSSEKYREKWENILQNTKNSLRELFGWLHIENHPIYNNCAREGLLFFGFYFKDNYIGFEDKFKDFKKKLYLQIAGHATSNTPHKVPINIEIDQLFNVIDKLKLKDVKKASDARIKELYELILEEKEVNYWQISPGRAGSDALEFWPEFKDKGIIAIGWDELGDLRDYKTVEDIEEQLVLKYDYKTKPKNDARSLWQFANEIKGGDIVIAKKGSSKSIYGVGIIDGDYNFDKNREGFKHVRKVNWLKTFDEPKNFPNLKRNFVQYTVGKFKKHEKYRIIDLEELLEVDFSQKSQHIRQKFKSDVFQLLNDKKQVILYGPPGTGKTYKARKLAVEFLRNEIVGGK